MVLEKLGTLGEGRKRRNLYSVAELVNTYGAGDRGAVRRPSCAHKTDEFRQRLDDGEELDDLLPEAFAVVREAATPHDRAAPLRRPADGRRRAAQRQHRRDEDR